MIPSFLSPEIKSNAERKIFKWLKEDPLTNDWVVLHSLGISKHRTNIYGEIDFVIIAPLLGVFVLEVKGGRVMREDGIWYFTNKYGQTTKKTTGPFEQAKDGMFSLFDYIISKKGVEHRLSKLFRAYGVMFPDIQFPLENPEIERWQIFDADNCGNVGLFIKKLAICEKKKWIEKYKHWDQAKLPDVKIAKELTKLLRGDFETIVSMGTIIRETEKQLLELTNEQTYCLDQIEDNPRCLIMGSAGTGKTLLAIEDVKKSVLEGKRVALFCFNAMLAEWLKKYFDKMHESLQPAYIGTFHAFLMSHVKQEELDNVIEMNEVDKQEFYSSELPLRAYINLSELNLKLDKVIIDEAQDLLKEEYLDVIDISLRNGIERGNWSLYGDFDMQSIYNQKEPEQLIGLMEDRTSFIKFKLKINCRNSKPIIDEIKYLTGFEPERALASKAEGLPVNYFDYKDDNDQIEKLTSLLSTLKANGVPQSDITILSPYSREKSLLSRFSTKEIADFKVGINNKVTFSTVNGFKGLENSVIIIVDIDTYSYRKTMYVGLSRARTGLFIFQSKKASLERINLMRKWV